MRRTMLGLVLCVTLAAGAGRTDETRRFEDYERSAEAFSRGLAAYERGRLEDARLGFEQAVELDGAFVEAMVNLARLHLRQGQLEEAEEWIERSAAVRTDYPELDKVRALVALEEGRASDAIVLLNRARKVAPEDVEVLTNLGAALLAVEGPGQARSVLERAVRLEPGCAPCLLNLALAMDHAGDAQSAGFYYRQFLAIAPRDDVDRAAVQLRLELLAVQN